MRTPEISLSTLFNFLNRVIMDTLKNKNPGYLPGKCGSKPLILQ